MTGAAIAGQFAELERRDFARLESPAPRLAYIFKHSITQAVFHQTLLESQRQELHLAVARVLEAQASDAVERLAHHYTQADLRDDAVRAGDSFSRRGRGGHSAYANETALAYFGAPGLETRWDWLRRQGRGAAHPGAASRRKPRCSCWTRAAAHRRSSHRPGATVGGVQRGHRRVCQRGAVDRPGAPSGRGGGGQAGGCAV